MTAMLRPSRLAIGLAAMLILVGVALFVPLEVRHTAPFGFRRTLDGDRGIAVTSTRVTPNYPDFNRIDLDLRAYTVAARYDLTVTIQPAGRGAAPLRSIPLGIAGVAIRHNKGPLADPFVTLRFEPIAESAGRAYDVLVQTGPRNRDDIVTLWSVKTYSAVSGREVLIAFVEDAPGTAAARLIRVALVVLLVGFVAAVGWLCLGLAAFLPRSGKPKPIGPTVLPGD